MRNVRVVVAAPQASVTLGHAGVAAADPLAHLQDGQTLLGEGASVVTGGAQEQARLIVVVTLVAALVAPL